ncbi:MAG: indole-3-glycerol phosphate synthase TrpC [Gemmatimonadota bacterium]|nr:indole-3-glycerol phosphate synthase TrpC [Gemmatimonadota bacterium]
MSESQEVPSLPGILASIVATKRREVEHLRGSADGLEAAAEAAPAAMDFRAALAGGDRVSVIAECKRRSPGAGEIRPGLDPAVLTSGYEAAGASALSVLTDAEYFGGSLADLAAVRRATGIPILRKDFTLDPIQVVEARAGGADAVLLIVRILTDVELRSLLEEARGLGLGVLVETHHESEVRRALEAGADVIGINNRDLSTFTTDLDTTARLLEEIPPHVVVVSESGIRSPDDVGFLGALGVDAVLVGETLLRRGDPAAVLGEMAAQVRRRGARA